MSLTFNKNGGNYGSKDSVDSLRRYREAAGVHREEDRQVGKSFEDIQKVEVQLKVVKPATALNKETSITVTVPGGSPLYVAKTCDTLRRESTSA